ncbi:MAG: TatD family hydrolase [Deltaproteobacteria bacterium]|nr:TatD family hydrolase [Deltaproteobacteria bacterium]
MEWIDTHAHLTMLKHADPSQAVERASRNSVTRIVTVGTEQSDWESNRALASKLPGVFYALGLHPHQATDFPKCAVELHEIFSEGVPERCVAIGEVGLDFHYNHSPKEVQIDIFEAQLAFAYQVGLPVIIHCREAFSELFTSLRKVGLGPRGGVMHCFSGDASSAKEALELGLYLSFSGIVTFKDASQLREVAKTVPSQCFVIETDSPYLAPMPFRGKPNEPSYLPLIGKTLASVRNQNEADIAQLSTENAIRLFGI